jgi:hypothetical protein
MTAHIRRFLVLIASLSAAVSTSLAQSTAESSLSPSERQEYERTIQVALDEFELQNYEEAKARFQRAHQLFPSARTFRALGMVEYELKKYVAAIDYLEQALTCTVRPLGDSHRSHVEHLLNQARGYVVRYWLVVTPPNATVLLDDELLEPRDGKVTVIIGDHTLSATAPGYEPTRRPLHASLGENRTAEGGPVLSLALTLSPCANPLQQRLAANPMLCCWPGQASAGSVCEGQPTCPSGWVAKGATCVAETRTVVIEGPAQAVPADPGLPTRYSTNVDLIVLPMVAFLDADGLADPSPVALVASLGLRVGFRLHSLASVAIAYTGGVSGNADGLKEPEAMHVTYLLAGLHRARRRRAGERDLFLRTGVVPYFRTLELSRHVRYAREGWGIPLSLGVNFMRGRHFGVGLELHAEWLHATSVCEEQGFGRCVSHGELFRLGLGLAFNWSAP